MREIKELTRVERNGYVTSGLDLTVRARTIQGEIVAFTVEPEGTSATVAGKEVELESAIASIDRIVDLLDLLKNCGLKIEDNKVKMVNQKITFCRSNADANCSGDVCAGNVAPCSGYACGENACAGNVSPCGGDACGGDACVGNVAPCGGSVCGGDACIGNSSICAGNTCLGDGCGVNEAPCVGAVCAENICGTEVTPCVAEGCAGDGHVGPCIHVSYCPIIL